MSDEVNENNKSDRALTVRGGDTVNTCTALPSIITRINELEVALYHADTVACRADLALRCRLGMVELDVFGKQAQQEVSLEERLTRIEQELGPLDTLFRSLERCEEVVQQRSIGRYISRYAAKGS